MEAQQVESTISDLQICKVKVNSQAKQLAILHTVNYLGLQEVLQVSKVPKGCLGCLGWRLLGLEVACVGGCLGWELSGFGVAQVGGCPGCQGSGSCNPNFSESATFVVALLFLYSSSTELCIAG